MRVKKLVNKMLPKNNVQFDFMNNDGDCIAQYNLNDLKIHYPRDHDIYFLMQKKIDNINIIYQDGFFNYLIYLKKEKKNER